MKTLCLLLLLAITQNDSGLYDKQIKLINGSTLSMSQFKGSALVIFEFDFTVKSLLELKYLDSLVKKNPSINIIAFPTADFSSAITPVETKIKVNALNISFPVSEQINVSKSKGKAQHDIFKWLTSKAGNKHFDEDVSQSGTLYVISRSGELKSVIDAGATDNIKNDIILYNQSH